jgi:hypothetical protein
MHYVIQILSAILIGISIGALLGQRTNVLLVGSLIALALGIAAIVTASWIILVIGVAVFLVAQAMQGSTSSVRA